MHLKKMSVRCMLWHFRGIDIKGFQFLLLIIRENMLRLWSITPHSTISQLYRGGQVYW